MPVNTTSSLRICQSPPPEEYSWDYPMGLYHSPVYLKAQTSNVRRSFWLLDDHHNRVLGNVNFDIHGTHAVSQSQAPFGSFQGAQVDHENLKAFLDHIEKELSSSGIRELTFHHPASIYRQGKGWALLLATNGYSCQSVTNHHLEVVQNNFYQRLHSMHRRKVKKCQHLNFKVFEMNAVAEIYEFIAHCRDQRQQILSMTAEEFIQVVKSLPTHFMLSGMLDGNTLAAAMITVKYNPHVWYNFYPAHDLNYHKISPMISLIGNIYTAGFREGIKYLDLGTSQLGDQANEGLLRFKTRIGGIPSYKVICSKQLN